jgi:hypothetical protein
MPDSAPDPDEDLSEAEETLQENAPVPSPDQTEPK